MAGTIVSDTLQDGAGNSTATTNAIKGSAKVWINFNGNSGGTAINASYNVSSLTRNTSATGVGNDYDLIGGNTRLSGLIKQGKNPKIWVVDMTNLNEDKLILINNIYS